MSSQVLIVVPPEHMPLMSSDAETPLDAFCQDTPARRAVTILWDEVAVIVQKNSEVECRSMLMQDESVSLQWPGITIIIGLHVTALDELLFQRIKRSITELVSQVYEQVRATEPALSVTITHAPRGMLIN